MFERQRKRPRWVPGRNAHAADALGDQDDPGASGDPVPAAPRLAGAGPRRDPGYPDPRYPRTHDRPGASAGRRPPPNSEPRFGTASTRLPPSVTLLDQSAGPR